MPYPYNSGTVDSADVTDFLLLTSLALSYLCLASQRITGPILRRVASAMFDITRVGLIFGSVGPPIIFQQ